MKSTLGKLNLKSSSPDTHIASTSRYLLSDGTASKKHAATSTPSNGVQANWHFREILTHTHSFVSPKYSCFLYSSSMTSRSTNESLQDPTPEFKVEFR
ncbi:hypothetical protein CDAR_5671 [Caerostris darwini]|uniref:Uncharacterized protein n=1 Tax=Caerostris darwini TaxID=1538125 RepID=A0AAV4VGZ9_9ARAC|nr:hypothetical protein CDAR_5671 [Caerostris darwini]